MEHCDGCSKEFTHKEEAYLFNDMGIILCPECMVEVKKRLKQQGKHEEQERMSAYNCYTDETLKQHDARQREQGKLELAREIVEAWKDYSMDTIVERLKSQLKEEAKRV